MSNRAREGGLLRVLAVVRISPVTLGRSADSVSSFTLTWAEMRNNADKMATAHKSD